MKHKPILLNALENEKTNKKNRINNNTNSFNINSIVKNIVIAVSGTSRGVGCTHTAITISNFLANSGNKVALVEMNENNHFSQIFDPSFEEGTLENSFVVNDVDYYPTGTQKLINILSAGYKYIVLDLSIIRHIDENKNVVTSDNFIEMQRANKQILVCGIKDWQLNDLKVTLGDEESKNWDMFVTFADQSMFSDFTDEFNNRNKLYLAPFCPDLNTQYKEQHAVFCDMLNDVLMKKNNLLTRKLFNR